MQCTVAKHPHEKVRVWVKTKDEISMNEREQRSKSYSLEDKPIKNAKQEDTDKAYGRVHEGLDDVGRAASQMNMEDFARAMAGNDTCASFASVNIHAGEMAVCHGDRPSENEGGAD